MDFKTIKKWWKLFWHFIWEDNSIWSWIANIILSFVLIKYLVFPVLGFVLNTSYPVVAVVSGSMDHRPEQNLLCGKQVDNYDNNFDGYWNICGKWYETNEIKREEFIKFPFSRGFAKGNVVVLFGEDPENIQVGDVIVFQKKSPVPIIHRVVKKWKEDETWYFRTKGDHNQDVFEAIGEAKISAHEITGKAVFRVPLLGYVKILFVEFIELFRWQ
ncbi:MAG: signal peptidase I [Candidatus Woesearchaeota archaeon]